MREIKFRGKRIDNDEWVYGSLVLFTHDGFQRAEIIQHHDILDYDYHAKCIPVPVKIETVGQYTGLKDKNKKEIYGEDIMEHYSGMVPKGGNPKLKTKVFWNQKNLCFMGLYRDGEIIGDIYSNPELLKGE